MTEAAIGSWHDETDGAYRRFWDPAGSDHWGVFDVFGDHPDLFVPACRRADELLRAAADVGADDRVLDVACGNGTTARWLSATVGCRVTGVDLSRVKIDRARAAVSQESGCEFHVGSATRLSFADGVFDVVWSQAGLYQVLDRPRALREFRRVLRRGGRLVFDDLTTPEHAPLGADSMQWVYDRLLFAPTWSVEQYCRELEVAGFRVRGAEDLTAHLRHSYVLLHKRAQGEDPQLPQAYLEMVGAIDRGDLGWARFTADVVDPEP